MIESLLLLASIDAVGVNTPFEPGVDSCHDVVHTLQVQENMQILASAPVSGAVVYTLGDQRRFPRKTTSLLCAIAPDPGPGPLLDQQTPPNISYNAVEVESSGFDTSVQPADRCVLALHEMRLNRLQLLSKETLNISELKLNAIPIVGPIGELFVYKFGDSAVPSGKTGTVICNLLEERANE